MPTYGLVNRPPLPGTFPDRNPKNGIRLSYVVNHNSTSSDDRFFYGTVDYREPLPFAAIARYDLLPIDTVENALFALWLHGDKDWDEARWLAKDYLAYAAKDITVLADFWRDPVADAAIILSDAMRDKTPSADYVRRWLDGDDTLPCFDWPDNAPCTHPAHRVYAWHAHDDTLCAACCDCGAVLCGAATQSQAAEA